MPAICTVLLQALGPPIQASLSLLFPGIFILCFQHWTAPKLWPLCTHLLAANKWTRPAASLKMIFAPRTKWPVGVLPLYVCIGDDGKAEKRLMRGGSQDKCPCGSSCIHLRLTSAWNVFHSLCSFVFVLYTLKPLKNCMIVLGDMVIFHIVISPACEIVDTRYYHAWVGVGNRETLCTCHRLFHNYLVILKPHVRERERERKRESMKVPITKIIYFQTLWKTKMLNIKNI